MARKKAVEFNFNKAFALIEALDKDKEKAVEQAIKTASHFVQKDLMDFADKKAKEAGNTGLFRKALKENLEVVNDNGRIEMYLGFYKDKPHGMVANYFNKGTPTTPKTAFIDKAFRNKKAVSSMNYVLSMYWKRNQEYINKISEHNNK